MKGLERRVAVETNDARALNAMGQITPVQLPGGPGAASAPRLPSANVVDSVGARIASNFADYAVGELGKAAQLQHERSLADGQMAAHQAKTYEEVQMGGDKWALEGFRLVEAQRMASTLLTAQQAEIASGAYELDPDQYRARFVERTTAAMESASDPRVAELAREQLLKQMPVLADDHMVRHLQWKEQRNFDALAQSVDTISMDTTAHDALISFATGGPGSATAGLSEDRRREAVTAGVVQAFENDNPQAYAVLASAGIVKTLPLAQQQAMKNARASYEARMRKAYNADFIESERGIMQKVETGQLEPRQAMEMYASLMSEHNMTMTASEAGVVYDAASAGVRGRKANTALLAQEAMLRGDRGTAVDLIERSLTGTESSGNAAAFRTNDDGRSFAGLLQFGAERLADYNRATGKNVTVDQFRYLTADAQRDVNRWHINDVLNNIEAKGYDKLVGQVINGVEVTLPGLVAVEHLGGRAGLDKFIKSGGQYNPSDEEGTSLTDYLRKHGSGVNLTPEQTAKATQHRIDVLKEAAAIDAYEGMQSRLDDLDLEFKRSDSTMTEADWRRQRAEVRAEFGVQKTMADAKFERDVVLDLKKAAEADRDNSIALAAGAKIETLVNSFDETMRNFAKGQGTIQNVLDAQTALREGSAAIRAEFGITQPAAEEIAQYRKQKTNIQAAMTARMKWDDEQAQIDAGEASGTLDRLPANLQKRAIEAERARVEATVREAAEVQKLPQDALMELYDDKMATYYARTGVVDPVLERTMNGFLSGKLVDKDGNPNMAYIEAAEQYRLLFSKNPALADKYVQDDNRPMLDAVMHLAGQGDIAGAVRTIGIRQTQAPRAASTKELLADPKIVASIDTAVSRHLNSEEVGLAQATFTSGADVSQVMNSSWFDVYGVQDTANRTALSARVTSEVARMFDIEPLAKPSEVVAAAARRVKDRTPVIGGIAVPMPMNGPTANEVFFGARAGDVANRDGAIQEALLDHFRSDEFTARYPFATDTSVRELLPAFVPDNLSMFGYDIPLRGGAAESGLAQTLWTGVRPFQTYYDTTANAFVVQFDLASGGSSSAIVLDAATIGRNYIKKHTAAAAE